MVGRDVAGPAGVEPDRHGERTSSRRRFVRLLGRGLVALWGVGAIAAVVRFLRPAEHRPRRNEIVVPSEVLGDLEVGDALLVPDGPEPIHLIRLGPDTFQALSATCTHLRCILRYDRDSRTLVCPCHLGRFDVNGNVLAGLPSEPLPRHRTAHRFGEVVIEVSARRSGGAA